MTLDWRLFLLAYLVIGTARLLRFEWAFRRAYKGDVYEFMASQLSPSVTNTVLLSRLVVAVITVLLWFPWDLYRLCGAVTRRLGAPKLEPSDEDRAILVALRAREDELASLARDKKRREHYLRLVEDLKRRQKGDDETR